MSIYIKVTKDDVIMGVLNFEDSDVVINFFDKMYEKGFKIEKITEEQYNSDEYGDEVSSDDINNGNYKIG